LGIKYSIILEEANPNELIGTSLNDPEAKKNIIRNLNGIAPSDAVDINNMPDKVRDNFRDDSINLTGKIIVASDDSYAI
jgi:adenosine/AMP kinase